MKIKLTAFLATVSLCGSAYSATWGTMGNVTVALSISYKEAALQLKEVNEFGKLVTVIDPETKKPVSTDTNNYTIDTFKGEAIVKSVTTDEKGVKISVSKFGNAELLKFLVDDEFGAGLLPKKGKAPFIAGWTLIAISEKEVDSDVIESAMRCRHTDNTIVEVPDFVFGGQNDFEVAAIAEKRITTSTINPATGDENTTETYSYADTFKGIGSASVPSFDGPLSCTGLLTGSHKVVFKSEGTGAGQMTTEVLVPGAIKLDKIMGVLNGPGGQKLVEGSISIAPGIVIDTSTFFPGM
jgi:hypothetical protein